MSERRVVLGLVVMWFSCGSQPDRTPVESEVLPSDSVQGWSETLLLAQDMATRANDGKAAAAINLYLALDEANANGSEPAGDVASREWEIVKNLQAVPERSDESALLIAMPYVVSAWRGLGAVPTSSLSFCAPTRCTWARFATLSAAQASLRGQGYRQLQPPYTYGTAVGYDFARRSPTRLTCYRQEAVICQARCKGGCQINNASSYTIYTEDPEPDPEFLNCPVPYYNPSWVAFVLLYHRVC